MVHALLEGRKSQTRRIIKPQAPDDARDAGVIFSGTDSNGLWSWLTSTELDWAGIVGDDFRCPYGVPGDLLWVRETCRTHELSDEEAEEDTYKVMELGGLELPPYGLDGIVYKADGAFREIAGTVKASEAWVTLRHYAGRRGSVVPAIHMPRWASRLTLRITDVRVQRLQEISQADAEAEGMPAETGAFVHHAVADYRKLWNWINGPDSWDANPWVWVVTFDVLRQNVDEVSV